MFLVCQWKRMFAWKTTDDNTMPEFDIKGDKLVAFAKFVFEYRDEAFYELNMH